MRWDDQHSLTGSMVLLPSSSAARSSRAPPATHHLGRLWAVDSQMARSAAPRPLGTQSPFMSTCQSHDNHLSQAEAKEALLLFAKPISSFDVRLHAPRDDRSVRDVRSP